MESAVTVAHRLMARFEDRLPLYRISRELSAVLREHGHRVGEPVSADMAAEAVRRLELAAAPRVPSPRSGG
jgi:hypothetical protein